MKESKKIVRYEGCFLEGVGENGIPRIANHQSDNFEDHHILLNVYIGEDKMARAEVFIRVTNDEKLKVIVNKIDHWEDGDFYEPFAEMIGSIDVKIPPLTIKRQLGDDAVDWVEDNVNKRSK